MNPTPGSLVGGKYRIVRLIGEGGMGSVYEARHEHLGTRVALKFLHPDLAQRSHLVARFLQEARVSASIKSPHVTQVMDVDETPEGEAYFVMELLEGESLEQRLGRSRPLPMDEALDIAVQILSALEAAHAVGVVHRDLKPDNVWLVPSPGGPYVKLLDFGIAKLRAEGEFKNVTTRPGSMMGTPAYMAPEQAISADQVDPRADLYSFGVMLYEMLSGARPVDGEEAMEILERLMRGEVHPLASRCPHLPRDLTALVDALVAPNPDQRPAGATLVRTALARFVRESLSGAGPSSRLSAPVPATVPPEDPSVPPYVTRSQPVAQRVRTSSMPEAPEPSFGSAPTVQASPSEQRPRRQRRHIWPILLPFVGLLAGAAVWAFFNPSVFGDDPLPPLPTAATAPKIVIPPPMDAAVPGDPRLRRRTPSVPRRAGETGSAEGETGTGPKLPEFPMPFPIPSGVFSIPSSLPPFFPKLPSLAPPKSEAPASSTAQ